jgi:hypothetical protein
VHVHVSSAQATNNGSVMSHKVHTVEVCSVFNIPGLVQDPLSKSTCTAELAHLCLLGHQAVVCNQSVWVQYNFICRGSLAEFF